MQYSVITHTDVKVSRISFGTGSLHQLFSARQRRALLGVAADEGISHFDTSPYYGLGLAETDLGIVMQGRRDALTVTTKVGLYPSHGAARGAIEVWARKMAGRLIPRLSRPVVDWSVQRAARSLDASLLRLKTDYVDFVFLHEPDINLLHADELLSWCEREKSKGKVRYWGLAGLPQLLKPWLSRGHPFADVLQVKDSIGLREADFVLDSRRDLQFTYGYLSVTHSKREPSSAEDLIARALRRNTRGSVIVSTRRIARIRAIARTVA